MHFWFSFQHKENLRCKRKAHSPELFILYPHSVVCQGLYQYPFSVYFAFRVRWNFPWKQYFQNKSKTNVFGLNPRQLFAATLKQNISCFYYISFV